MTPDIAHCKQIQRHYGKSYFFATRFFPAHLREATYVLYAFFREPDEIVDTNHTDTAAAEKELVTWINDWHTCWESGGTSGSPVLRATYAVCNKHNIPFDYTVAFLNAMKQDLTKDRYATYAELEDYMYGSAAVVGRMMSHVIGFTDEEATMGHADALGEAMQLTNFLRDIGEDYQQRGRIYLPQDELERFGITEHDITEGQISDNWRELMQFQITRARALYTQAEAGIHYLNPEGRKAVLIASRLYGDILREIEQADYSVFARRARTSILDKVRQSLPVLFQRI